MQSFFIEYNGIKHPVKVFYERRNDSRVSLGKRFISIRIPLSLSREERFRELSRMRTWAEKKLAERPDDGGGAVIRIFRDGEVLRVGDRNYTLRIDLKEKQSSSAHLSKGVIYLSVSSRLDERGRSRHISALLSRILGRERLKHLRETVERLNREHFNAPLGRVFFKNNKSTWGSCSGRGNINVSTRLLFAPDDVLEYICVHELAHLLEFNHSPRFWSLVEKAVLDYREKEKWLDENGNKCGFLPGFNPVNSNDIEGHDA